MVTFHFSSHFQLRGAAVLKKKPGSSRDVIISVRIESPMYKAPSINVQ